MRMCGKSVHQLNNDSVYGGEKKNVKKNEIRLYMTSLKMSICPLFSFTIYKMHFNGKELKGRIYLFFFFAPFADTISSETLTPLRPHGPPARRV